MVRCVQQREHSRALAKICIAGIRKVYELRGVWKWGGGSIFPNLKILKTVYIGFAKWYLYQVTLKCGEPNESITHKFKNFQPLTLLLPSIPHTGLPCCNVPLNSCQTLCRRLFRWRVWFSFKTGQNFGNDLYQVCDSTIKRENYYIAESLKNDRFLTFIRLMTIGIIKTF